MVNENRITDRIDRLISRYLDGEITEPELAELDDAIKNRQDIAARTSAAFLLHRQIQEVSSEDRYSRVVDSVIAGAMAPPKPTAHPPRRDTARGHRNRSLALILPAVAASLAAAIVAVVASTTETTVAPARETVAAVTSLSNTVWAGEAEFALGSSLRVGDLVALSNGFVKLTYNCGAEVQLQGPCEFVVLDAMQGELKHGRLTADVPARAFGFGVVCPGTDVIDLGTSFGVSVSEAGETDLHVFDGEVMCAASPSDNDRSPFYRHVHAQESVRFVKRFEPHETEGRPAGMFDALRQRRVDRIARDADAVSGELALWLTADQGVELDSSGRVAAWADLLTDTNRSCEDALQPDGSARPQLVDRAIGERPAVRFDGASQHLVTTPLATTDEQTIAMVVAFSPASFNSARRWGGQIINYDGPPSRETAGVVMPGVIQIGESLRENEFVPAKLNALAFAGFVGATPVEAGRVDSPTALSLQEPAVVIYRYSYAERTASLWVNGAEVATSRAVAPVSIVSRKIIGRHAWMDLYFGGDLAELRIYNEALEPRKLSALSAVLGAEYGIPVASNDVRD